MPVTLVWGAIAAGLCSPRPCVSIMTMKAKDTRASNVVDEVSIERSPTKPTWDVLRLRDLFNRGHHNIYNISCRQKNSEKSTRRISSVHKNAVHRNGTCPLQSKKFKGRENPLFVSVKNGCAGVQKENEKGELTLRSQSYNATPDSSRGTKPGLGVLSSENLLLKNYKNESRTKKVPII